MKRLCENYRCNLATVSEALAAGKSFDLIERRISALGGEVTFFFVDGFIKDGEMQRIMQSMISEALPLTASDMMRRLPYVEVSTTEDVGELTVAVLSGQAAILSESFGGVAILVDARTYPARGTEEPSGDRVMQGAKDGFVETLIFNTALIRRRIRDPRLRMRHLRIGSASSTDVVMCYVDGVADEGLVTETWEKLNAVEVGHLSLGFRSLAESLVRRGWLNPFPKIRTTERPDTAAAQLLEGNILIICDTSPQVMILPTSIFDFLQQTDDYYLPPLTGSYLRIVRTLILLLSVVITPLWYLAVENASKLPEALSFLVPQNPGALPIILQLFLVEIAVDGLKIASMNTPDMLSNSLSVIGALIIGDFAVTVGWLCPDVILYMAFVSIAGFAQQNAELGYAFKFMRMLTLLFVFGFGAFGLLLGGAVLLLLVGTISLPIKPGSYLYPLIPFSPRALSHLFFRTKKQDFKNRGDM